MLVPNPPTGDTRRPASDVSFTGSPKRRLSLSLEPWFLQVFKALPTRRLALTLAAGALLGGDTAGANVTPFVWYRLAEDGFFNDSSGNARHLTSAYSGSPGSFGGQPGAFAVPLSTGGPLGKTGTGSTIGSRWGAYNRAAGVAWSGELSFPAENYVLEAWILPLGTGAANYHLTNYGQIAGSAANGLAFRTEYNPGDPAGGVPDTVSVKLLAGGGNVGDTVEVSRTQWTHLAAVNVDGELTFYVNGEAKGEPVEFRQAITGSFYVGGNNDAWHPFNGYIDEVRYATFEPGAFTLADLLLVPPGPPVITTQPQNVSVWEGGAARFSVEHLRHGAPQYQWKRGGAEDPAAVALPEQTGPEAVFPQVTAAASHGLVFHTELTLNGATVKSGNATLTVTAPETDKITTYRQAVESEPGLFAYFPADDDTGDSAKNTRNNALSATIRKDGGFDGRTDRSFGKQALVFKGHLDGGTLVTVPGDAGFEFPEGAGTIEALVYLDTAAPSAGVGTILSAAADGTRLYELQLDLDGTNLRFNVEGGEALSWPLPSSARGRLIHIALTVSPEGVTAYVDGVTLGTRAAQTITGWDELPVNIGSSGINAGGVVLYPWHGTIDELAVYSGALSASTVARHNARARYGSHLPPPLLGSLAYSGFSFTIEDGAASELDPDSLELRLDGGSPLTLSRVKTGSTTTFTYAPTNGSFVPAGSHSLVFSYRDRAGESHTHTLTGVVAPYRQLPESLAVPLESAGTAGFSLRVFQTASSAATNGAYINYWEVAEGVLAGVSGEPYLATENLADQTEATAGKFHAATVNFEQSGTETGHFPGDTPFPGIPGTTGSTDYFVSEALTWVRFPAAGYYTLGVTSDDGFRASFGHAPLPALEVVVPSPEAKIIPVTPSIAAYGGFGANYPSPPIQAKLVLGDPILGGSPYVNAAALKGNIVVVERGGGIAFTLKAQHALDAGAVGVLVINQTAPTLIPPVSTGTAVHIPYGHISKADGDRIKALIAEHPEGVEARLGIERERIFAEANSPADTTFGVLVTTPGLYPLRLAQIEAEGGASLEWFSVDSAGERHLLGDTPDPQALAAFASVNAGEAPAISVSRSGDHVVIQFIGVLQSSPDPASPFTDVQGAASPYTVPAGAPARLFFRARP